MKLSFWYRLSLAWAIVRNRVAFLSRIDEEMAQRLRGYAFFDDEGTHWILEKRPTVWVPTTFFQVGDNPVVSLTPVREPLPSSPEEIVVLRWPVSD